MSRTCQFASCDRGCYGDFCIMHKPRKPIAVNKRPRQDGKEFRRWKKFREETAIPYLDKTFGHFCRCCGKAGDLDIDHIHGKGSRPELKYQLSNLQYLCRFCHIQKTNELACIH